MGIVRVITAMEDFCVGIKAEHDRYAAFQRFPIKSIKNRNDEEGFSPRKLYQATEWRTDVLERYDPVYDYFSKVRNCIAHRSGRASKDLVAHASSLPLKQCLATWHHRRGQRPAPALPEMQVDQDVVVLPRHAILAKEACQRIATDANAKLIKFLGADGVVYMAAYHSLLSERRLQLGAKNDPEAMLNAVLDRYRVTADVPAEGIKILRKLGIWGAYKHKFESFQVEQKTR